MSGRVSSGRRPRTHTVRKTTLDRFRILTTGQCAGWRRTGSWDSSDTGLRRDSAPGIGRTTAEKIVLELREKVGEEKEGVSLQGEIDVLEALKSLGYSQMEAREALKKVSTEKDTGKKIKEALKILGGK